MKKVLIWDWPVRIGHWMLVAAFVLARVTGDSENWRLVHVVAGGSAVGIVTFRLIWGVAGTKYARFADFVRGPRAVLSDVIDMLQRHRSKHAGHNAAGGWAIVALLTLGLLTGATGWLAYQEVAGEWLEEAHEAVATGMLMVAVLHVFGVIISSLAHRENLVRAMFTGYKLGPPDSGISSARPWALVLLLGWVATCAWWLTR